MLAQFDLLIARPSVRRPSLTLGLNLMPVRTALLYALIVSSARSAFTSSSFLTSSSSVSARTLVTCLIRYSSRSIGMIFLSKICQAN